MKTNKIFTLIKQPGKATEIRLIDKELKAFNAIIEGKREIIPFPQMPGVCIIFDGSAAANNKKPSCFLPEYGDLLLGSVIFAGIDLEAGFMSLTEEQADRLEQYIKTNNAKEVTGEIEKHIKTEYLPNTDDNAVYSFLSEVKTKYKSLKVAWLKKR